MEKDLGSSLVSALNSSGNKTFTVMFNNTLLEERVVETLGDGEKRTHRYQVRVRRVSLNNVIYPEFGYFKTVNGHSEFQVLEGYLDRLNMQLQNKIIGNFNFNDDFSNDFVITINDHFKIVNIEQSCFHLLCKEVYKKVNNGSLKLPSGRTIDVQTKEELFNYFANLASFSYNELLRLKILNSLKRDNAYRFYGSLWNYTICMIQGPAILNPILDCERFYRGFKETQLYKYCQIDPLYVGENNVMLLTNKEICQCLGLDRYIRFSPTFLMDLLLRLLNPNGSTYGKDKYFYVAPNGKAYTLNELGALGLDVSDTTPISSLRFLVMRNRANLNIADVDLVIEILETATLL